MYESELTIRIQAPLATCKCRGSSGLLAHNCGVGGASPTFDSPLGSDFPAYRKSGWIWQDTVFIYQLMSHLNAILDLLLQLFLHLGNNYLPAKRHQILLLLK